MAEHTDTRSGHPIEAFLDAVLDGLTGLVDVPAWSMDEATTTRVVGLAARVAAGMAELEARSIRQAQALDLPAAGQCRSTARWLQQTTAVTGRTARAKTKLAGALVAVEATRTATARGEIHAEQAQAIEIGRAHV